MMTSSRGLGTPDAKGTQLGLRALFQGPQPGSLIMRKEGERVMQLPTSLPLGLEPRASTSQAGQLPNMYLPVRGGASLHTRGQHCTCGRVSGSPHESARPPAPGCVFLKPPAAGHCLQNEAQAPEGHNWGSPNLGIFY